MNISSMATRHGISKSAIRYYERQGLLGPVTRRGGHRFFGFSDDARLAFIRLALATGFSIAETREILEQMDNVSPAGHWRTLVNHKRDEIQNQIERYHRMLEILAHVESCNCDSLEMCGMSFMEKTQEREISTPDPR